MAFARYLVDDPFADQGIAPAVDVQAGFGASVRDARERDREAAEARRSVAMAALMTQGINGTDNAFAGDQFQTVDQISQRLEQIRAEYAANGQSLADVDIRDVLPRLGIDVTIPANAGFISAESFLAYLGTMDGSARFTAADFAGAFGERGFGRYVAGADEVHPDLLARVTVGSSRYDPQIATYYRYALQEAGENGINPTLFVNQLWQESRFNPRASSGQAYGIGQFTPETGARYGLTGAELYDPFMSIEAGARHMRDLTREYGGDQILALVAYNGGSGAVDFVEERLGQQRISGQQWVDFMTARRARLGDDGQAWHSQTLGYVEIIAGARAGDPAPVA